MHYVYVLRNEDTNEVYYGYTHDLNCRLEQYRNGKGLEWKLVYYEAYLSESDARRREKMLKHYGQSRTRLKDRINGSLLK